MALLISNPINMDDIFCSFPCLYLVVWLSLYTDFHSWNPYLFLLAKNKILSILRSLSDEIYLWSTENTHNPTILLTFRVKADFHPAIIDYISISGMSQTPLSTTTSLVFWDVGRDLQNDNSTLPKKFSHKSLLTLLWHLSAHLTWPKDPRVMSMLLDVFLCNKKEWGFNLKSLRHWKSIILIT